MYVKVTTQRNNPLEMVYLGLWNYHNFAVQILNMKFKLFKFNQKHSTLCYFNFRFINAHVNLQ